MMLLGKAVHMSDDQHVKAVVWLGGVLAAVVVASLSGLLWAEDRYHHRSEAVSALALVKAEQLAAVTLQDRKLDVVTQQVQYSADLNEKRRIESELFKLEQTPPNKLNNVERATKSKLDRDLRLLNDAWNSKGRPLR